MHVTARRVALCGLLLAFSVICMVLGSVFETNTLFLLAAGAILGLDAKNGWRIFRRDRYRHASPNSAQTESVCAGLLGLRLAGDACYHGILHKKPFIGDDDRPVCPMDIKRANRLMFAAEGILMAGLAAALFLA